MRESEIEKHLVRRVKEAGGEIRKVKWIGRRGAPDRFVMIPEREEHPYQNPCSFWVELKAPGKKLEPHQEREIGRMRDCGIPVFVVDSIEGVEGLV